MLALLEEQQRIREFRAVEIEEDKKIAHRKVKLAENYVSLDKRLNARDDRRLRKARVDELKQMRLVPPQRRRQPKPASATVALARQQEQLLAVSEPRRCLTKKTQHTHIPAAFGLPDRHVCKPERMSWHERGTRQ